MRYLLLVFGLSVSLASQSQLLTLQLPANNVYIQQVDIFYLIVTGSPRTDCAGQSNTQGFQASTEGSNPDSCKTGSNCWQLRDSGETATLQNNIQDVMQTGDLPWSASAQCSYIPTLAKRIEEDVSLAVDSFMTYWAAVGGTSTDDWLFQPFDGRTGILERFRFGANLHQNRGTEKFLVWFQGESDAIRLQNGLTNAAEIEDNYKAIFDSLTLDGYKIIIVEPVHFPSEGSAYDEESFNTVDSILSFQAAVRGLAFIYTSDLESDANNRYDELHLSCQGQRNIGIRIYNLLSGSSVPLITEYFRRDRTFDNWNGITLKEDHYGLQGSVPVTFFDSIINLK